MHNQLHELIELWQLHLGAAHVRIGDKILAATQIDAYEPAGSDDAAVAFTMPFENGYDLRVSLQWVGQGVRFAEMWGALRSEPAKMYHPDLDDRSRFVRCGLGTSFPRVPDGFDFGEDDSNVPTVDDSVGAFLGELSEICDIVARLDPRNASATPSRVWEKAAI